ncbi:ABC transporter [Alsobacter metallidurans]|uniref:ABC transporter n=1 Tax=Alsobacter metallidurans TaxID=340221 RepID=A0A917I587_9HYPH|nr:ABC transporter ATP-binding protein [Alsobacter metallidurans]GGH16070.1 ABC transporter [Alsobacter metallidurans]
MPISASSEAPPLTVHDLRLVYGRGRDATTVLDVPALSIAAGAQLSVSGPSGSGKTSLLHVLTGIERPTTGLICWGSVDLATLGEGARDAWRRRNVGLVFQDFHLAPQLSALENVLLPLRFDHWRLGAAQRDRAQDLLDAVGLAEPKRRAGVLSRGEQQRVAIARALIRDPRILAADEPTASLDAENRAVVADLLLAAARRSGATLLVVTHDAALLGRLGSVIRIANGSVAPVEAAA